MLDLALSSKPFSGDPIHVLTSPHEGWAGRVIVTRHFCVWVFFLDHLLLTSLTSSGHATVDTCKIHRVFSASFCHDIHVILFRHFTLR